MKQENEINQLDANNLGYIADMYEQTGEV